MNFFTSVESPFYKQIFNWVDKNESEKSNNNDDVVDAEVEENNNKK